MAISKLRRPSLYVAVFLISLGTVGCSSSTSGTPSPASSSVNASSPGATSTSSTGASPADALQSLDACTLLTDQEAAQFKATGPGKLDTTNVAGAASDCRWSGRSSLGALAFGVQVRPSQGIDDVNSDGGQLTKGDVQGRPAAKFATTTGGDCLIALAVSPTARVDVSTLVAGATDSTEACQAADTLAGYVNAKIPPFQG